MVQEDVALQTEFFFRKKHAPAALLYLLAEPQNAGEWAAGFSQPVCRAAY